MKVHGLIALSVRPMLHETRVAAFNLHTASCLLLNVLDVGASVANYLCSQVKAWDRLEIDGYALFWPFALQIM